MSYLEKQRKIFKVVAAMLICSVLIVYAMTNYPQTGLTAKLLVDPAKMVTDVFSNVGFAFGGELDGSWKEGKLNFQSGPLF